METHNDSNQAVLQTTNITQSDDPSYHHYLADIFDQELLKSIDSHLVKHGRFNIQEQTPDTVQKYPYLQNLKEICIIPAIPVLLDRQITQFIRFEKGGSFSFYIMKIENSHQYPFLLTEECNVDQSVALILIRMIPLAMLFHAFGQQYPETAGIVPLFHGDKGRGQGSVLAYCSNQHNHVLLPDSDFLTWHAYQNFKDKLETKWIPWEQRKAVAYWIGSTTGDKESDIAWRKMARFRLCQTAANFSDPALIYAKIARITDRFSDSSVIANIQSSGFIAAYAPPIEQVNYKYLIDIDGHGSSWAGLILRLLSGSTVLKIDSERGFIMWFHDRLIPWENYIPIKSDFSNLEEIVLYLKQHDGLAKQIAESGRQLANDMTLEHEIYQSLPTIFNCLKDNSDFEIQVLEQIKIEGKS